MAPHEKHWFKFGNNYYYYFIAVKQEKIKNITSCHFNSSGYMTSVVDRNGNATTYSYSSNKLSAITDPVSNVWMFAYDGNGNIDTITDQASRVINFDVDASGNLIKITNPDSSYREFTYKVIWGPR